MPGPNIQALIEAEVIHRLTGFFTPVNHRHVVPNRRSIREKKTTCPQAETTFHTCYPQSCPQVGLLESLFRFRVAVLNLIGGMGMTSRTTIAETYLRMLPGAVENRHDGMYVRLAARYGVPFGRIVNLSGLSAEVVLAHLEVRE